MTTTAETYRALRRDDPYLRARDALAVARSATAAEAAGVPAWPWGDETYPVEIDGRSYTLTVKRDEWLNDHDWDCLGHVRWRDRDRDYVAPYCFSPVPPWPCVPLPAGHDGSGTQSGYFSELETYYDPGEFWEPYAPRGMARGPAREWQRRQLVAEGLRVRSTFTVGLILTDEEGHQALLWGIDWSGDGTPMDRAYFYDVAVELAAEIEAEREREARARFEHMAELTSHG